MSENTPGSSPFDNSIPMDSPQAGVPAQGPGTPQASNEEFNLDGLASTPAPIPGPATPAAPMSMDDEFRLDDLPAAPLPAGSGAAAQPSQVEQPMHVGANSPEGMQPSNQPESGATTDPAMAHEGSGDSLPEYSPEASADMVIDFDEDPNAKPLAGQPLTTSSISPRHQLEAWLAAMVQSRASDLILRAGGRPSCRVDGRIQFLPGKVPAAGALLEVLNGVVGEDRMSMWHKSGSVDVAVQLDGLGRFRLNAYKQMGEPAVVLRRIGEDPPMLESLGLPTAEMKRLSSKKRGIVLVTGIAGSGKSTTLSAMIQFMNLHYERHVITLEDPVELLYSEDRCVISQREVGTDCETFYEGLRHSLRQSPDVILIGEMRDAETVNAALDATETGHLVMSTLHTVNAAQTLDRILSFFPSEQHQQVRSRLAENIVAVLSQRLVPRATGKGMMPAFELMTSTPHVRELIEDGRTSELSRVIDQSGEAGLISFNMSLRDLVSSAAVDLEIALSASDRPDELMMALRGFKRGGDRGAAPGGGQGSAEGPGPSLRMAD